MNEREKIIRLWFDMWLKQQDLGIDKIFTEDVVYTESWCPKYENLKTVKHWFNEWNTRGKVIIWDIKQFFHKENQTVVEWYFKNEMNTGSVEEFDGISLIEWTEDNTEGVPEEYTVRPALLSEVTFGSMTFLAAPAAADVDLTAEPVVDTESAESIPVTSFDGVSVYDWDADASDWAASNPNRLAKGDLVYLVYDENGVLLWVVRPQKPEEPEFPDDSIIWGGGGGGGEAPAFEMYDRTETELMRISPMDTVSVQMLVDEMDILSVHTGQEAEITVDALPGRAFTGTVTAIDPNGKNNGGNSKYTVTITMPRAENMLDGMNAMAVLTVGTTENVLWLPAEALAEQGFKTVVYTGFDAKTGELTGPVEVVTGVSDGDKVEIVSGLEEGQTVWYIAYESAEAALFASAAAPESA